MIRLLLVLLLCLPAMAVGADSELGKQAYWKGDFTASADAYRRAVNSAERVPDLWFNLGTAEASAGRYGHAVHAFEQALALRPGDPGARHNLEVVRSAIIDRALKSADAEKLVLPGDDDVGTGLLSQISPTALHLIFAIAWCTLFALLWFIRRSEQTSRRAAATFAAILLGLVAFSSGGLMISRTYLVDHASLGVIVADRAYAHQGPGKNYPKQATIAGGVKVRLGGRDRGWHQVTLPNGLGAWVKSTEVLPVER